MSKIRNVLQASRIRYASITKNVGWHVDNTDCILEHPRPIGTILKNWLVIGIILASVDVNDLQPETVKTKKVPEADVAWDDVTNRTVDEVKTICSTHKSCQKAASAVSEGCALCDKQEDDITVCLLSPKSRDNWLGLSAECLVIAGIVGGTNDSNSDKHEER